MKTANKAQLRALLPARRKESHKGDFGRVLVVAGSRGMAGAAVLAARAALKAGAGLVTVACPETERRTIACALPEAMTFGAACAGGAFTPAAAAKIAAFARRKEIGVVLIGPGLGESPGARAFARKLLAALPGPAVVDADALNALAAGPRPLKLKVSPAVFTPHPGEAARLLGKKITDRRCAALALAKLTGGAVILKGAGTLVCLGGKIFKNYTGGPELAKGGSGDVLAGLCAGLLAQMGTARGFTPETALGAARLAAHLHGRCGGLAAKKFTSRCVLAGELLDFLPAAFRSLER
ncbi:MAG: NAD(P)H-hydrate dehydratase [Elusimicrobia bacterium]|nr:NAD(P)H-hydrate dehydratase [Elusimicrobiota bacterium]